MVGVSYQDDRCLRVRLPWLPQGRVSETYSSTLQGDWEFRHKPVSIVPSSTPPPESLQEVESIYIL